MTIRFFILLYLVLFRCALAAPPEDGILRLGEYRVGLENRPFALTITDGAGSVLLPGRPGMALLRVASGQARVTSSFGRFDFQQDLTGALVGWEVTAVHSDPQSIRLTIALVTAPPAARMATRSAASAQVVLTLLPDHCIRIRFESPVGNRLLLAYPSPPDESFMGFGEQYNRVLHEGIRVPIWTSEQGIGRTDSPIHLPFNGRTTDTYFPIPWYLSTCGKGVLLETSARSVFDLRVPPRADRVGIEVWDSNAGLLLVPGPRPADVLRRLTAWTGRPRRLPSWAFGTWLGLQGGRHAVEDLLDRVVRAGAPVSAVWVQDWVGHRTSPFGYDVAYHWSADPTGYPDLAGMISALHGRGIRFLGYFNSFIESRFPEFQQGAERHYLVEKPRGAPWNPVVSTFRAGMVDLSNTEAREWLGMYFRAALKMGMDGWMADFGEWLPWDGVIAAPEGCPGYHNRYPLDWARLNREVALSERPDGDFVIFSRSGYTGSAGLVDMVWAGDQNTSWGGNDGLGTVIPAGLNLGLSGVPFYHFDAGGFTSLVSWPRGNELLKRWVEAAALSPVLRTHEGYWRQMNAQVYGSVDLLAHFAQMSRLHERLRPRIEAAAREAEVSGMPIMRHLYLEHPEDPECRSISDEYYLGSDLLAAPVLVRGATTRRVYFPAGTWRRWSSVAIERGPGWKTVAAPIGDPPLYVREN